MGMNFRLQQKEKRDNEYREIQAPIFEIPIVQQESQHGRVSREDNLTQCVSNQYQLGLRMKKPTIWVFDQVLHKPGCTVSEDS